MKKEYVFCTGCAKRIKVHGTTKEARIMDAHVQGFHRVGSWLTRDAATIWKCTPCERREMNEEDNCCGGW